jgi:hypothetical protein
MCDTMVAADYHIRDMDMASELIEFTKNLILLQSSTSMLAQANLMPGNVMGLLNKGSLRFRSTKQRVDFLLSILRQERRNLFINRRI